MQIKRFEAPDMQQALRWVKETLGPEAIILSTKSLKKPNGRTRASSQMAVEVVAAIETGEYTSLFNQLLRFKRPLSYLTNGHRVPEGIELATKGRVAQLVLNRIQWN
jgi:flagellar biosynthesis GTPase FlhF